MIMVTSMSQSRSLILSSLCDQRLMNADCILVTGRAQSGSEPENTFMCWRASPFHWWGIWFLGGMADEQLLLDCTTGSHTCKLHVVQLQVCYCLYITKFGLENELRRTVLTSKLEMNCVGKERPCAGKYFSARSRVCARERNKTLIHLHVFCLEPNMAGQASQGFAVALYHPISTSSPIQFPQCSNISNFMT